MVLSHSNIAKLQRFLRRWPQNDQPAAFEYLIANVFSQIFDLPFQSKDNEDSTVSNRVIWYGSIDKKTKTISKSPPGSDAICYAYGYNILIESTLRSGTGQWRKEFVESLKHYDSFVCDNRLDKKEVYLAFVVPKLHRDTYTGFKQKVSEGYNIIFLENTSLAKIGNITKLIFTVRHLDMQLLFDRLIRKLRASSSFNGFRSELNKTISEWGKDVLKSEKTVFFGLKSYEAMKNTGRKVVGTSDILLILERDNKVKQYIKMLDEGDLTSFIRDGLISEKLACLIPAPGEDLFCRVNYKDFNARGGRVIRAVEGING